MGLGRHALVRPTATSKRVFPTITALVPRGDPMRCSVGEHPFWRSGTQPLAYTFGVKKKYLITPNDIKTKTWHQKGYLFELASGILNLPPLFQLREKKRKTRKRLELGSKFGEWCLRTTPPNHRRNTNKYFSIYTRLKSDRNVTRMRKRYLESLWQNQRHYR